MTYVIGSLFFLISSNQSRSSRIIDSYFAKCRKDLKTRNSRVHRWTLPPNDRLSRVKEALRPRKTIRDAVHGDIIINRLEVAILDTAAFQRLRHIRQLGPSYLVYPCLNHTRFDHCLGTLKRAQDMIDAINRNPDPGRTVPVDSYQLLLTRTSALIHDLSTIPFGHTLEDEGNLLDSQWNDQDRVDYFLGAQSDVGKILVEQIDEDFRTDVIAVLLATGNADKAHLEPSYAFVADIVGNTVCADLLDYLRRDIMFAGLNDDYDDRFLSYLFIPKEGPHKDRLAVRLWHKGEMRRDIISELVNLLRLRYTLAEKVYFHHAKIAASVMIIEAVSSFLTAKGGKKDLLCAGDDELMYVLGSSAGTDISQRIIADLKCRKLYSEIASERFKLGEAGQNIVGQVDWLRDGHAANRRQFQAWLEAWAGAANPGITSGTIAVYCPSTKMQMKEADVVVQWGRNGETMRLRELDPDTDVHAGLVMERVRHIQESHKQLWRLSVFMSRDLSTSAQDPKQSTEIAKRVRDTFNDVIESVLNGGRIEDMMKAPPEPLMDHLVNIFATKRLIDPPLLNEETDKIKDWCRSQVKSNGHFAIPPSFAELTTAVNLIRQPSKRLDYLPKWLEKLPAVDRPGIQFLILDESVWRQFVENETILNSREDYEVVYGKIYVHKWLGRFVTAKESDSQKTVKGQPYSADDVQRFRKTVGQRSPNEILSAVAAEQKRDGEMIPLMEYLESWFYNQLRNRSQ